MNFRNEH